MEWNNRYVKSESKSNEVEVKGIGYINLDELPIKIHEHKEGNYQLTWLKEGNDLVLHEVGGRNQFDYGGMRSSVKEL